jgi:hypothetical protein
MDAPVWVDEMDEGSGDDAESAGPRDLLAGGEADLEEAEGLELPGAGQLAGVDGLEAARGDGVGELRLGVGVVAGEENRGGVRPDDTDDRVAAKVVLKALTTFDCGRARAISEAADATAGTTRESNVSKFTGLVMSTTVLPESLSPRSATIDATAP